MATSWELSGAESRPDACCLLRWVPEATAPQQAPPRAQHSIGCWTQERAGESGRTGGAMAPSGHRCVCTVVQMQCPQGPCYSQAPPLCDQRCARSCDQLCACGLKERHFWAPHLSLRPRPERGMWQWAVPSFTVILNVVDRLRKCPQSFTFPYGHTFARRLGISSLQWGS